MNRELSAGQIYHDAIKALATAATGEGTLPAAEGRALVDNPLCGDRVEMEVRLSNGRVIELAHRVKGCLLCRAAAAAIGRHARGADLSALERVAAGVSAMLAEQAPAPEGWPALDAFAPVHGHRSRYRCVQLPFEAVIAAVRAAGERS